MNRSLADDADVLTGGVTWACGVRADGVVGVTRRGEPGEEVEDAGDEAEDEEDGEPDEQAGDDEDDERHEDDDRGGGEGGLGDPGRPGFDRADVAAEAWVLAGIGSEIDGHGYIVVGSVRFI